MHGLIKTEGLLGFITGEVAAPPKLITVPCYGSPNGTMEIENPNRGAWERSDALLKTWILKTVTEDIFPHVVLLETAKDMWTMLESTLLTKTVPNTEAAAVKNNILRQYLPLYTAAIRGDWESAQKFLKKEPDAVRAIITVCSETLLIVAIRSVTSVSGNHFVKKVLELMSPEDLALPADDDLTALHYAATSGNVEAAKLMVAKNPNLPNLRANNKSTLPLANAALNGQRSMVLYLLSVTNKDSEPKPLEGERGAILIHFLISNGLYDIALSLIEKYSELASMQGFPALKSIAFRRSAFPSGAYLNWWQSLIYCYAPLKLEDSAYQSNGGDIENLTNCFVSFPANVPQMKYIQETKCLHNQAIQLVKHLCKEVGKLEYSKALNIFQQAVITAAKVGVPEVVEEIIAVFPDVIRVTDAAGHNIFHIAILNRHENIFNLIYQLHNEVRQFVLQYQDLLGKSGIELVACLGKEQRINLRGGAAGAALQMQRELQWFKEVEKISRDHKESRVLDTPTPRMIFSETHEELIKEGEKWMKDTANSCTIIAALIVTIVFAAAITVPGGNNSDGHPIFSSNKAFITFGVSDAVALFSSSSSLLMFLSILASRYAEEDFLNVLPRRLVFGLLTLFISIISMMIAFGATLYLVFGDKKTWILAPITILSTIPGTLFVSSQFPLLLDMIKSTYGIGVFCQQNDRILY